MDNFEQIIKKAIADQDIPGCAGVSSNCDGIVLMLLYAFTVY
jgi:hypothetical protein